MKAKRRFSDSGRVKVLIAVILVYLDFPSTFLIMWGPVWGGKERTLTTAGMVRGASMENLTVKRLVSQRQAPLTRRALRSAVSLGLPTSPPKPKLLDQARLALRARHYSRRTEEVYGMWIKRFIFFHGVRRPAEMAEPEINAFLTHLAVKEKLSALTQNQVLSALLFLYCHVLGWDVGGFSEVIRAGKPRRLPVVMTREEVKAVLANLFGDKWLMASLLYGAELRLMECLRLPVHEVDFARNEILVRDGKGAKDRVTTLPQSLKKPLQEHQKRKCNTSVDPCSSRILAGAAVVSQWPHKLWSAR